jgi:hypothetical protein
MKIHKFAGWWHIVAFKKAIVFAPIFHRKYMENVWKVWKSNEFVFCLDVPFFIIRVWRTQYNIISEASPLILTLFCALVYAMVLIFGLVK